MEEKSKVYILLDGEKIVRCEGGYTMANIQNIDEWVFIDEGEGDKYNLCQSNYFNGGLYDERDLCRWKYVDGECVLRTEEEMEADAKSAPEPEPTADEILEILLGVSE